MTLTHDDASGSALSDAPPDVSTVLVPDSSRPPLTIGRISSTPTRRSLRARGLRRTRRRSPARQGLAAHLTWRVLVATVGALLLVVCSGMALGIVTVSSSGLEWNRGDGASVPPYVTGLEGAFPGGPAHNAALSVSNRADSAFEITGVSADLAALPADCPAGAWKVGAPGLLPTVPARAEVTVLLPVGLVTDAPDTCQGATIRFPARIEGLRHPAPNAPSTAMRTESIDTTATLTVARLGSPGGTLSLSGGRIALAPTAPRAGPQPGAYDVELIGEGSERSAVCSAITGSCVDQAAPPAAARTYVVTARVGAHWRRTSPPIKAWSPPPAPALGFVDGDRGPESGLAVEALAGDTAYSVGVHLDGASTPFHSVRVPVEGLSRTIASPRLAPGRHSVVAVARFHGWRATSATLWLTISSAGQVTAEQDDAPAPVTDDGENPPLVTTSPPVATRPSDTSTPSTREPSTTTPSRDTQGSAGPPIAVISAPSATSSNPQAPPVPAVPPVGSSASSAPAARPPTQNL